MNNETNITVATKVASSLDKNLDTISLKFLVILYKEFPILGHSLFGLTYGQILAAIFIFFFIFFIRSFLSKGLSFVFLKLAKKTKSEYDDKVIANIQKPLKFSFLLVALYVFFSILLIKNKIITLILGSLAILNFFWYILAILNALSGVIYKATNKINKELSSEFAHFIVRIIKIIVWVIAASSILSLWGINVTALIASLGIGGLAFALAAKDTAANLFGSIAILLDKSIKIGDWVKVDGVEGIVEDIGMRTTKIRTFEKSLITLPNSIVANSPIENFSRRNVRRIKLHLGLIYDTSNEQLEAIIQDIQTMLKSHPGIAKNQTMLVNFDNFGDSAKELFIYTFTNTAVWKEYLDIKEDVFYKISEIVTKHGSDFAFPSQSLYIEKIPQGA